MLRAVTIESPLPQCPGSAPAAPHGRPDRASHTKCSVEQCCNLRCLDEHFADIWAGTAIKDNPTVRPATFHVRVYATDLRQQRGGTVPDTSDDVDTAEALAALFSCPPEMLDVSLDQLRTLAVVHATG